LIFYNRKNPLSIAAVQDMLHFNPGVSLQDVTHLIVVSCTGMYAPGLDIDLIRALDLSRSVQRTCIQFMGCYAAFNALKVADAICRSAPAQKVLIVCTELCSIHFQQQSTDDNILANALFGDGSACMLVESAPSGKSLSMHSFYNDLAMGGAEDMAWNIADEGFQMVLSTYVPDLIRSEIRALINSLLSTLRANVNDIAFYAMHPGGVKILRAIEEELGVSALQNEAAYEVLKKYGNMSSATVVFVLKEIFARLTPAHHNRFVMSMGFGPGLTLESMLLQIHYDNGHAD
jgi:predicted naringenin-chalcone synthase